VAPVWPPMEKLNIEGKVILQVWLSLEGKVESIKVVSGHPMLFQAAIDAVKQWEYRPFLLNGQPVRVETTVEVPFSLLTPEQRAKFEAAAKRFYDEEERCGELIAERKYAAAEVSCATLPELSEKLDQSLRLERVRAYRDLGAAYFIDSKFQDALTAFQRELELANARLGPTNVDTGHAYADVAHGLQSTSHHDQAATNYAQAIGILEQARKSELSDVGLRPILRDYAQLLRQLGRMGEAAEVEQKLHALSEKAEPRNQ
ncbi:MAG TPA: TonB family protein, partial [Candidatus Angelobacter sp.]